MERKGGLDPFLDFVKYFFLYVFPIDETADNDKAAIKYLSEYSNTTMHRQHRKYITEYKMLIDVTKLKDIGKGSILSQYPKLKYKDGYILFVCSHNRKTQKKEYSVDYYKKSLDGMSFKYWHKIAE